MGWHLCAIQIWEISANAWTEGKEPPDAFLVHLEPLADHQPRAYQQNPSLYVRKDSEGRRVQAGRTVLGELMLAACDHSFFVLNSYESLT